MRSHSRLSTSSHAEIRHLLHSNKAPRLILPWRNCSFNTTANLSVELSQGLALRDMKTITSWPRDSPNVFTAKLLKGCFVWRRGEWVIKQEGTGVELLKRKKRRKKIQNTPQHKKLSFPSTNQKIDRRDEKSKYIQSTPKECISRQTKQILGIVI